MLVSVKISSNIFVNSIGAFWRFIDEVESTDGFEVKDIRTTNTDYKKKIKDREVDIYVNVTKVNERKLNVLFNKARFAFENSKFKIINREMVTMIKLVKLLSLNNEETNNIAQKVVGELKKIDGCDIDNVRNIKYRNLDGKILEEVEIEVFVSQYKVSEDEFTKLVRDVVNESGKSVSLAILDKPQFNKI